MGCPKFGSARWWLNTLASLQCVNCFAPEALRILTRKQDVLDLLLDLGLDISISLQTWGAHEVGMARCFKRFPMVLVSGIATTLGAHRSLTPFYLGAATWVD
jgi:hypothetical protein